MANSTEITKEGVEAVLNMKPELRDQFVAALDEEIERLQSFRAMFGAAKKSSGGRRSESTAGNTRTHGEAVKELLAKHKKSGLTSRELREKAKEIGHRFGGSLGTTLNNLYSKEEVTAEPEGESGRQYRYFIAAAK